MPGLDRAGVHAESVRGFGDGEQSFGAEAVVVAGELVRAADVQHDLGGEWFAGAGVSAGGVELSRGLGVGVIVEELVEQLEGVGVGLACLPGVEWDRDREAGRLAAAEADVQVDLVGFVERDVFDQQPCDPFAFAGGCGWVGPECGEVGGELSDLGLAGLVERGVGGGGLAVVFVLGVLSARSAVVPVGFEGVGDEPVVGVDGEIAASGEFGVLAGAVDV